MPLCCVSTCLCFRYHCHSPSSYRLSFWPCAVPLEDSSFSQQHLNPLVVAASSTLCLLLLGSRHPLECRGLGVVTSDGGTLVVLLLLLSVVDGVLFCQLFTGCHSRWSTMFLRALAGFVRSSRESTPGFWLLSRPVQPVPDFAESIYFQRPDSTTMLPASSSSSSATTKSLRTPFFPFST